VSVELLAQESLTFYEALGRARPLASGWTSPPSKNCWSLVIVWDPGSAAIFVLW